jgi:hypothetical protein
MEVRLVGREVKVWCVSCRVHVPVRERPEKRAA